MNRKTICRVMTKKLNDYLSSIEDPEVKKVMEEKSYITGGSIVSMLLNEKVSDYDFYLKDKDAALKVSQYYVEQFKKNNIGKHTAEVIEENERVKIFIKSDGILKENDAVEERNGDDVIAGVEEADDISSGCLDEEKGKYRPVYLSANAITLSNKVQIVIRFYGDIDEVHKNYDFIHCTNSWDCKTKKLTLVPEAMESILARHLQYCGSLYPVCSVIRTRKFIRRGWHINAGQYLKMCFQISELNLSDINVLEEQLTGVDAAYFYQIIKYCRKRQDEDESFKVTSPYLVSIVDKIFN